MGNETSLTAHRFLNMRRYNLNLIRSASLLSLISVCCPTTAFLPDLSPFHLADSVPLTLSAHLAAFRGHYRTWEYALSPALGEILSPACEHILLANIHTFLAFHKLCRPLFYSNFTASELLKAYLNSRFRYKFCFAKLWFVFSPTTTTLKTRTVWNLSHHLGAAVGIRLRTTRNSVRIFSYLSAYYPSYWVKYAAGVKLNFFRAFCLQYSWKLSLVWLILWTDCVYPERQLSLLRKLISS